MKRKGKIRRLLSGMMAAVTLMTSAISPYTVYAAEGEKPPLYEEIKDLLDADEVVSANDHVIEYGADVDLSTYFAGLEIPNKEKVKVTFQEAKNASGEHFSSSRADTYVSVYYVNR